MSATVSYAGAKWALSKAEWEKFISNPNRWSLVVEGKEYPPGTDFEFKSKFGAVKSSVVLQPGGASFDRPEYTEAPFVQTIVWGRKNGRVHIGMV